MHHIGTAGTILAPSLLSLAFFAAGCGSGEEDEPKPLTVSAASSLIEAFEPYGEALPGQQRFSFGGSDELAAQIRQGAQPDVYAAANTSYPEGLAAEGLLQQPVVFAQNQLVIVVPRDSTVDSIADLGEPDLDLVVCAVGVPCGDYTSEVLNKLPAAEREAIMANVRAEESDVKGVVGKVVQGAADAGFVYASDAAAAGEDVESIEIPARLEPNVQYGVAVVRGAADPEAAREFVTGLLDGAGAEALREAGFLPPP